MAEDQRRIEEALRRANVPSHVADHIRKQSLGPHVGLPIVLVFIVVCGAGWLLGAFLIWPRLERLTQLNAWRHAVDTGAYLYHYNFGFSMLIAMFAWMLIVGACITAFAARSERLSLPIFVRSLLDVERVPFVLPMLRNIIARRSDEIDVTKFIQRVNLAPNLPLAIVAVALSLTAVFAAYREVQTHSLYGPDVYVRSAFLPWVDQRTRLLSSAESVEVGCNHVSGKNSGDYLVYKVRFPDGVTIDLGYSQPRVGSWIDAVEVIDGVLAAHGAEFKRWAWLDRDPLHPACMRAMEEYFRHDGEYERLRTLLRADGLR